MAEVAATKTPGFRFHKSKKKGSPKAPFPDPSCCYVDQTPSTWLGSESVALGSLVLVSEHVSLIVIHRRSVDCYYSQSANQLGLGEISGSSFLLRIEPVSPPLSIPTL